MNTPLVFALALLGVSSAALAQSRPDAAPSARPAARAAAPAATAPKPAEGAAARRLAPSAQKAVEESTPIDDDPTVQLTPQMLEVARAVYVGEMKCELGASVVVRPARREGLFLIVTRGARFLMHPVESRTGAIRLEDPRRGAMWLQLGNKSMLMSQRLGRRLADECQSPEQVTHAEYLKRNPAPSLLEGHGPMHGQGGGPGPMHGGGHGPMHGQGPGPMHGQVPAPAGGQSTPDAAVTPGAPADAAPGPSPTAVPPAAAAEVPPGQPAAAPSMPAPGPSAPMSPAPSPEPPSPPAAPPPPPIPTGPAYGGGA